MRPLWLTGDSARAIDTRSYQWGKAFLVSPILKPGVKDQTFYLPAGHWFDFYTDSVLTGGTEQRVATRPDGIPTYVKAGSFVAMAEPMQHTGQYNSHALELHYYHHASVPESTDSLYDDDGRTPDAYATGQYELLYFEAEDEKSGLELEIDRKPGTAWTVKPRELEMVIHGLKQAPQSVKLGRKRVKYAYENGVLRFKVKVSEPETELFIKYGK
jgi:oligosaccharide 4-alpha-D-glucosyltransferase